MTARSSSRTWRMTSETCCCSSARDELAQRAQERDEGVELVARVVAGARGVAARLAGQALGGGLRGAGRARAARRAGQAGPSKVTCRAPSSNEAPVGPVVAQRGRQHQRALVAVDAHHELEADLLQRDLALLGEGQVQAQLGRVGADHELLREALVQDRAAGRASSKTRVAEAVEHRRADDLLAEVRRAQHRHRREGGLDLVERRELALAPGAEVRRRPPRGRRG